MASKTTNFEIITSDILKKKKFNKFTIPEIKNSLRHYEIKFKSNLRKQDLYNLLNSHVMSKSIDVSNKDFDSNKVIKIQSNVRKWLIKNRIKRNGFGSLNIMKCQNEEDPISLELLSDINPKKLVVYCDKDDNKYYGFEIINLYDLFKEKNFENPLTLKHFDEEFIDNFMKNCENYRNYLPQNVSVNTYNGIDKNILEIKRRSFDLFHNYHIISGIPNLESQFYLDLNCLELKKFYDGLQDLWDYRILQGNENPVEFHRKYVPDDICLFSKNKCTQISKYINNQNKNVRLDDFENDSKCQNLIKIHDIILTDLENFFNYPKEDDKITTIFWVLTVLTEINLHSAEKFGQFLVF